MMNIEILDYEDDLPVTRKEIFQLVEFYGSELMVKDHREKLKVIVSFDDSEFPTKNPRTHMAFCTTFYTKNVKKPTEFMIELNRRLTRLGIIKALAHEMVHVRQYSTGQLFAGKETIYNGVSYNVDELDYFDWPWEIEAFGYEVILVHKYRLFCKETGFNVRPNKRRKAPTSSHGRNERVATAPRLRPVPKR